MSAVHALWHGLAAVAVGAVAGVVVVYLSTSSPDTAPARSVAPRVSATAVPVAKRVVVPYDLYTHCGIRDARIGNRDFEAVHPLGGTPGSPPPGWGNPYQAGTMTLVSPTEAVFTDHRGHRVVFTAHPGARQPAHLCS